MDIQSHLKSHGLSLTEHQWQAVTARESSILLLAVPGAGKTTALATRVAHIMTNDGVRADCMLNLTFNKESAKDMTRRFEGLFSELCPGGTLPRFSTIHSFCYSILRSYANGRGTQLPTLLTDGLLRKTMAGLYGDITKKPVSDETLDTIINLHSYCQNRMYIEEDYSSVYRDVLGFEQLCSSYKQYKLSNHCMDFDDLLSYTLTVLQKQPKMLESIRERYTHLQLDEAQDMSLIQHAIVETLAIKHLFFVGDEDQSIYRFRGACPTALLEFTQRHPGGIVLKMEQNFRSGGAVVRDANRFIAGNRQRYPKKMHTTADMGSEIAYTPIKNTWEQYSFVAKRIAKLPVGTTAGVLFRGGLSAAAMGDALLRRGIPFALREKRYRLMQDLVVRDIIAFLRFALNPGDERAFLQIYYKLGCYVNRELAGHICNVHSGDILKTLDECEDFPGKSTARIHFLQAFFKNLSKKQPKQAILKIVDGLDYLDSLLRHGVSGYTDEALAQRLGALVSIAENCENIPIFLERLERLDDMINSSAHPAATVTISTVHSVKGREFDFVYVIDLLEGVFPASSAIEENLVGDAQSLEEEARLFYVAITRPRQGLELLWGERFCSYDLLPSRFLDRLKSMADGGTYLPPDHCETPIRRGTKLSHRTFGFGTVESVGQSAGQFTVRFAKLGVKTFSLESLSQGDIFRIL